MILLALLLILAASVSVQASVYHDRVIHVHKNGNDGENCLMGQQASQPSPNQCCRNIEFVANKLQNRVSRNVTIILETKIRVKNAITFSNHEFLTIQGRGKGTTLNCNCDKSDSKGISFINIKSLKLTRSNIIECCGVLNYSNYELNAGVFIQDCSDITIENTQIRNNKYSNGLILVNPSDQVNIRKCKFSDNGVARSSNDISFSGAGLHIEFFLATVVIEISYCEFVKNKLPPQYRGNQDPVPLDVTKKREWNRQSTGGGMAILLLNGTNATRINVSNCHFVNNRARWGGGLCIYAQEETYNNTVFVTSSTFVNNSAEWGGGGVQIRLGELDEQSQNHIHFESVTFGRNYAFFGGGTSVSALLLSYVPKPGEILKFINCTWDRNGGHYSPAVDLSPYRFQQLRQGYSPIPLFKDIKVQNNYNNTSIKSMSHAIQGVFVVTRFTVHFQGSVQFEENWYTALHLTSGRAVFANCSVYFYGNRGIRGGAIAIHSFSALVVNDFSHFKFINNSAVRVGGGIYYAPIDQKECFIGQTCFLEYGGKENNISRRDISFEFDGNKAPLGGTSIYSESIHSCYYAYFEDNLTETSIKNLTKFFDLIGDFNFDTQNLNDTVLPLATAVRKVELNETSPLRTLPGKPLYFPLVMYDEFGTAVHSEIGLRVEDKEQVRLDNHFTVNYKTRVFGAVDQNATIVLSTPQQLCSIDYKINVMLLPCPPGFYYNQYFKRCWCSSDNKSHSYPAITKCDYVHFKAYIKSGYWVGYYPSHTKNESTLYTAFYPSIFNNSNTTGLLEITADSDGLSDFMCGSSREGILCGKCKGGYSAYYHSKKVTCGENGLCKFGIIFYILSDIIPTVIFFTVVITLGVSFSSGAMNAFVFFSQVVDVFSQDLIFSQSYSEAKVINMLQAGHKFIYGIFNIEFFSVFPFCLWEGATVLDALAFKYITTMFALVLITVIVIAMNFSLTSVRCLQICKAKKAFRWRKDSSVTHGISTFLIICYGQYTRVSFFILTTTYLQGKPGVKPIPVTYYGGLPYLSNAHLLYAVPAIICTALLVVLPPLLLLLYPLILHLLSLCGLSEHPVVNKTLQLLRINHLLPLFDSFQSCYKDKMRFYAGFYFLYRVAAFLAYMHSETLPPVFLALLILGIHSVLHPYKLWKHNAIDGLIFLDIAIINSITEMIKTSLITQNNNNHILQLKFVQLVFIYMPMIPLLLIILVKVGRKMKSFCRLSGQIREPSEEPSISLNRAREAESEITVPLAQLQVPLLNARFQYTL